MDKFPYITIVIPAYNEQDYIEYSLRSLTHQVYPRERYEILVVDNASTDCTAKIARKWGATVIPEARKGVARARQMGFMAAQGSLIASTDADTAVSPHWLAHIASAFYENPQLGGVYGPVYWPEAQPIDRWALQYPATWVLAASNRLGHSLE